MKIFHIPNIYVIGKAPNHLELKNQLLELISKSEYNSPNGVSKADYDTRGGRERPYADLFFFNILKPFLNDFCLKLNGKSFEVHNFWFQQYNQGSKMNWHVHPQTNYTGVYYLEYPHNVKTEIFDFKDNKLIPLEEFTEGEILIFPSNLVHRAPRNTHPERKTIISFNFDIVEFHDPKNL